MDEKQKKTFCYADEWMPLVPEAYRGRTKAQWLADFTRWGFPVWMRSGINIRSEPIFKREEISAFFAHRFKGWPSSYENLVKAGFPEVKAASPEFPSRRRPRKQKGNKRGGRLEPKDIPLRESDLTRPSTKMQRSEMKDE